MRILHIVAGLPREGGGLSELVPAFAREATLQGHDVSIATVAGRKDELSNATGEAIRCGVKLLRLTPTPPRRLFFSLEMLRKLCECVAAADVVHVHSNWTFPVWWGCHLALSLNKKLVMSPHGCLEPERLRRSVWKKRVAGMLFDRRYLRRAAAIHATCEAEAAGIEKYLGRVAAPPQIAVIPSGVDIEVFGGVADRAGFDRKFPECKGARVALFMSRLHPLKGVDSLLEAWRCVAVDYPEWRLVIAGPDEAGYGERIKRRSQAVGLERRVTFCGSLYGAEKVLTMKNASLFVLPTRNENFGIVVAEALACGVPVITTKGAPWQELQGSSCHSALVHYCDNSLVADEQGDGGQGTKQWQSAVAVGSSLGSRMATNERMNSRTNELARTGRAGWWVDIGVEPLVEALREAMSLKDEERQAMGENGRRLVEGKYRWETVAERMAAVYSGIVNRKP